MQGASPFLSVALVNGIQRNLSVLMGLSCFLFPKALRIFRLSGNSFQNQPSCPKSTRVFLQHSSSLIREMGEVWGMLIYWDCAGISQLFCQPIPNCPFGGSVWFLRCSWHSPFYTERLEKLFVYKELGSGRESACQEELGASSPVTPAGWGSLGKLQGNEVCLQSTCMHKKTCACAGGHV